MLSYWKIQATSKIISDNPESHYPDTLSWDLPCPAPISVWTRVTGDVRYTAGATSLTLQDMCRSKLDSLSTFNIKMDGDQCFATNISICINHNNCCTLYSRSHPPTSTGSVLKVIHHGSKILYRLLTSYCEMARRPVLWRWQIWYSDEYTSEQKEK